LNKNYLKIEIGDEPGKGIIFPIAALFFTVSVISPRR
jgi:hypothetical protein